MASISPRASLVRPRMHAGRSGSGLMRSRRSNPTPAELAPYAWYDAHLGGSATQITDSSTNARAAATFGAGSNSPLWLPYTGSPYVHLEAAGAGTNSISCTAPAGTASYSAAPLGGGAPTTGAAAPGAFTFTTAGDWLSITLLTAGAAEVAKFDASLSSQTGHTDSFAVAWTVNRGTSGRKTVVLSPAANSARSTILLATDDYITVPAAAVPALDTFAAPSSVVVVARAWNNDAAGMPFFATKASLANTVLGLSVRRITSAGLADTMAVVGDGAAIDGSGSTVLVSLSALNVIYAQIGNASPFTSISVNNGTAATDTSRTTTGTTSTGGGGRIGAYLGAATGLDMEAVALLTFDRALSAAEIVQLVAYYGGGT